MSKEYYDISTNVHIKKQPVATEWSKNILPLDRFDVFDTSTSCGFMSYTLQRPNLQACCGCCVKGTLCDIFSCLFPEFMQPIHWCYLFHEYLPPPSNSKWSLWLGKRHFSYMKRRIFSMVCHFEFPEIAIFSCENDYTWAILENTSLLLSKLSWKDQIWQ